MRFLVVGLGGGVGSLLRYGIGLALSSSSFPFATLIVNVAGCFLIGLAMPFLERAPLVSPELRLLLVAGFLGGFTTFSAFGYESVVLLRANPGLAAVNVAANVLLGLTAVMAGQVISDNF